MAIPYQPGYSISPRYGFRYGPSSHAPATSNGYQVPDDYTYIPPDSSGNNKSVAKQPTTMGTGSNDSSDDDNSMQSDAMARSVAQSRGYNQVQGNPLAGLANMIPVVGPEVSKQMGLQNNYGKKGTADAQGNAFGDKGFAYDLRTGAPAASYKDRETFYNVRKDNYNTLRDLGQDPFQSIFNTYHGSHMDIPKDLQDYGASAAGRAGIDDTQSRLRHNTSIANPDLIFTNPLVDGKPMMDFDKPNAWQDRFTGQSRSDFFDSDKTKYGDQDKYVDESFAPEYKDVSLADLGIDAKKQGGSGVRAFQKNKELGKPAVLADRNTFFKQKIADPRASVGTSTQAAGTGDVVNTAFGPGVVNESGQIETNQGTVIQMSGVNDNKVIQKPTQQESTSSGGKG